MAFKRRRGCSLFADKFLAFFTLRFQANEVKRHSLSIVEMLTLRSQTGAVTRLGLPVIASTLAYAHSRHCSAFLRVVPQVTFIG